MPIPALFLTLALLTGQALGLFARDHRITECQQFGRGFVCQAK